MQLPTDLQHFPNGALLVASDTTKASFFLLGGDSLEELDGVSLAKENGADGEGSIEFFPDDTARLQAFVKLLAEHITTLKRDHQIAHIHLVMPAEIEHDVSKHLATDTQSVVGVKLHHDVMNESPLDIVRRVVGEMGHAS